MSLITRQDTNGVKPLLQTGEFGYDNYPAGGDKGRVYVGTGNENIPLAKKAEILAVDNKANVHIARADNPHGVTKAQVGLGNVDNTSDINKPISTATQTALNTKVDKVAGKQLSTEDYTTADKNKLTGLSNYTKPASEPISYITGLQTALDSKVSKTGVEALHSTDALRISGTTLSLYKGDGTFESVVTQDTIYTLPIATSTVKGGIELFSDTVQTVDSNTVSTTAGRTYGIQLNSAGQAVVNVPWSNTVYTHPNSGVTAGTYSKVTVNTQGHITNGSSLLESDIPGLDASKITSGIIDAARLPASGGSISEYASLSQFPVTGDSGKVYIALDTNKMYRWSGSAYVSIAGGAVDSVAGKTGVVTLAKADVGLNNVDNTSDINKPISNATQTALDTKVSTNSNQTIAGIKTFSSNPISTATQNTAVNALTRKDYVDSLDNTNVKLTGDQTVAGVKTFSSTISGSISGNAATATKLATARTIALSGAATGTATTFDGTGNISIPVTGLDASNLNSGIVPDARLSGVYSGMSLKLNGNNTVFTTESSGSTGISRTVYGLAEYKNNSNTTTGAIVFIAPSSPSAVMHQLEVSGLLYNKNIVSLIVQGYRTTGVWSDLRKISTGTVDIQVRWGMTPDGKHCLILGDVGTVWPYPHIAITRAMFSYSGLSDDYCTGWTVALVTDFTGYTNISANIGDSTMTGNVSSATKLATARNIAGIPFDGTANINIPFANISSTPTTLGGYNITDAYTVAAIGTVAEFTANLN